MNLKNVILLKNRHVMVDLETTGSHPGCAILSIGAVEFSPERDDLGRTFYRNVDLQDCINAGLQVEGDAFYWWLKQSISAKEALLENPVTLGAALSDFFDFIHGPDAYIWSHGASFDLAVLAVAYQKVGLSKPWSYRNEMDTRTILTLAGMTMPKTHLAHQALEDAKTQAFCIMSALRGLEIT